MVMAIVLKMVLVQYSVRSELKPKTQVGTQNLVSGSEQTGHKTFHETLTAVGATDHWPAWDVAG